MQYLHYIRNGDTAFFLQSHRFLMRWALLMQTRVVLNIELVTIPKSNNKANVRLNYKWSE